MDDVPNPAHDVPSAPRPVPASSVPAAPSLHAAPPALPPKAVQIAGFWDRLAAFLVDWAVLAVPGYILGLLFFSQFVRLFAWGRPVGFAVVLLYFGVMGSSLGGGQTLGKRLMKLKVIDERGGFLPLPWSVVRCAVLFFPFFVNGWFLPAAIDQPWIGLLMGIASMGLGGAIIYLLIFNRATRQSLHDLAIGSYVVRAEAQGAPPARKTWWLHLAVVTLWILGSAALLLTRTPKTGESDITAARQQIEQLDHVKVAMVVPIEMFSAKVLTALASLDAAPKDFGLAAGEVAETLVDACPQRAPAQNVIVVQLSYGYDFGFVKSSKTFKKAYVSSSGNKEVQKEWDKLIKGK
jgi:uncharacterized RDD family membrane protein YckC